MTYDGDSTIRSTDVALMAVVLAGVAGLAVPPSLPRAGLSELERRLLLSILPLLATAFLAACSALLLSLVEFDRLGRLLAFLSLTLVNLAGLFSGIYGSEGVGVVGTLLVTSPVLAVIAQREWTSRRRRSIAS